jgi:hypothetical protein
MLGKWTCVESCFWCVKPEREERRGEERRGEDESTLGYREQDIKATESRTLG